MTIKTFTAVLLLLMTTSAWSAVPVRSLNDLPSQWTGVAGDMVTRMPMTLSINKILKVTRKDTDQTVSATYDVDSAIMFGTRSVKVLKIDLDAENADTQVLSLNLYTDDELNPVIEVSVVFDEASNMFTMRDIPAEGTVQHYFTLKAKNQ